MLLLPGLLALLAGTARAADSAPPPSPELRAAINRTTSWVEQHQTNPERVLLQDFVFDAWARDLIATQHPDPTARERVGRTLDRDLQLVRPTPPTQMVPLTYWALLLRLMQHRSIDTTAHVAATRATLHFDSLMADANPTTVYWTARLLDLSGLRVNDREYFATTWVAEHANAHPAASAPTIAEAYRLFHEIVPLTDLGATPAILTSAQRAFARAAVVEQLAFCRAQRHTDALAESLVSAILLGLKTDTEAATAMGVLLAHQNADGTFLNPYDKRPPTGPNDARHTVLVGLWALLLAAS